MTRMNSVICDHKEDQKRELKAFEKERLRILEVPRQKITYEKKRDQTFRDFDGAVIDLDLNGDESLRETGLF